MVGNIYVYHQADMNVHYMVTLPMLEYNWDTDINDFATITQVQVAFNNLQCS